jgi:hypothetical protein
LQRLGDGMTVHPLVAAVHRGRRQDRNAEAIWPGFDPLAVERPRALAALEMRADDVVRHVFGGIFDI